MPLNIVLMRCLGLPYAYRGDELWSFEDEGLEAFREHVCGARNGVGDLVRRASPHPPRSLGKDSQMFTPVLLESLKLRNISRKREERGKLVQKKIEQALILKGFKLAQGKPLLFQRGQ